MHKPDSRLSARRLRGPAIGLAALDALVGTRWRLIGANCLTLLARRWREDYRVR